MNIVLCLLLQFLVDFVECLYVHYLHSDFIKHVFMHSDILCVIFIFFLFHLFPMTNIFHLAISVSKFISTLKKKG